MPIKIPLKKAAEVHVPLIAFIIFLLLAGYLFFLRPPVIFVGDTYFNALFGETRLSMNRLEASFKIARQIRIVTLGDNLTPADITEKIDGISRNPRAVFFLFAYNEAAKFYAKEHAKHPPKIYVFLNKNPETLIGENEASIVYVDSDREADLYKAGRAAEILGSESSMDFDNSNVVYVQNITLSDARKEIFTKGLNDGGFKGTVNWTQNTRNVDTTNTSCVVFDSATISLGQTSSQTYIPIILFSWFSDESYLPDGVKVLFEDSPFYLIPKALGAGKSKIQNHILKIPSRYVVLKDRINNKTIAKRLKKL